MDINGFIDKKGFVIEFVSLLNSLVFSWQIFENRSLILFIISYKIKLILIIYLYLKKIILFF